MKFTAIPILLLSCTATALFRVPHNNPHLLPRQATHSISSTATFPSVTFTIPSGTGVPHSSHGTRSRPRLSASHHSAGLPHTTTRVPHVGGQDPSITASSFGTISSAGPVNGTKTRTRTRTSVREPTGGHSTTRKPRPTGTASLTLGFVA